MIDFKQLLWVSCKVLLPTIILVSCDIHRDTNDVSEPFPGSSKVTLYNESELNIPKEYFWYRVQSKIEYKKALRGPSLQIWVEDFRPTRVVAREQKVSPDNINRFKQRNQITLKIKGIATEDFIHRSINRRLPDDPRVTTEVINGLEFTGIKYDRDNDKGGARYSISADGSLKKYWDPGYHYVEPRGDKKRRFYLDCVRVVEFSIESIGECTAHSQISENLVIEYRGHNSHFKDWETLDQRVRDLIASFK